MADTPTAFSGTSPSSPEDVRSALHQAADQVADYIESLESREIFPNDAEAPTGDLVPSKGAPLQDVFSDVAQWAIDNAIHVGAPGYVGHMDSGVAVAGIMGDLLISALNQNMLAYELAPGATLLEKKLVRFFTQHAGLPQRSGGLFTTGGTTANLTAILMARNEAAVHASTQGLANSDSFCVFASADAHYSISKSCAVLGIGSESVIAVPVCGPERKMDVSTLPELIQAQRALGKYPIALVATAGTTSCGAIDPLPECAAFCEAQGLWFHVDAAHGGALLLHQDKKSLLSGTSSADSITLDPHKWLYTPKTAGLLLVRDENKLQTADYKAPYLDRHAPHGEALPISQGRRALDGSRRFDALKVWLTLRHLGLEGIQELLESRLQLTQWFYEHLLAHPFFKPSHRPCLNVLAFEPRCPVSADMMRSVHQKVESQGQIWPSYTSLDGRPCHRVVLINPSTQKEHLLLCLSQLQDAHTQELALASRNPKVLTFSPNSFPKESN
jgi:L-2,4-diaminobutyrate decarboxylase